MSDVGEKATEAIMVRLTPTEKQEVDGVAKVSGIKPATMARMGLLDFAARLRAQAPEISPEIARAIAAAKARGLDVANVLTDALERQVRDDVFREADAARTPAA